MLSHAPPVGTIWPQCTMFMPLHRGKFFSMKANRVQMDGTERIKPALERRAYTVQEIAATLGVSTGFVRLEIARGRLAVMRAGRRVLVSRQSFDSYCAE